MEMKNDREKKQIVWQRYVVIEDDEDDTRPFNGKHIGQTGAYN